MVLNKIQKCYILLFTCSVRRVIQYELKNDLGVEPFKLASCRFISRRGTPSYFISNNFKTFKSMEIKPFISNLGIKWRINILRDEEGSMNVLLDSLNHVSKG